jgi:hypothetical protein
MLLLVVVFLSALVRHVNRSIVLRATVISAAPSVEQGVERASVAALRPAINPTSLPPHLPPLLRHFPLLSLTESRSPLSI